jgi:hypothetical protein
MTYHDVGSGDPEGSHGEGERDPDMLAIGQHRVHLTKPRDGGRHVAKGPGRRAVATLASERCPVEEPHTMELLQPEELRTRARPRRHLTPERRCHVGGDEHQSV